MGGNSFWNEKYQHSEYLYSDTPNAFLRHYTADIAPGSALVPGDGDGRNGMWLSSRGFQVEAFDFSDVAVKKANARALDKKLSYQSETLAAEDFQAKKERYNLVAIIFLHLPKDTMRELLKKCLESLAPDGSLLIQVFSQQQLGRTSGGPKDINLLYTMEDFEWMRDYVRTFSSEQVECELTEGALHSGRASVVNIVAKK